MAYVYRYTDEADGIIKYVGIIWSDKRSIKRRIIEHSKDERFKGTTWKIEYINKDVRTRTDAECLEAHYIAKYQTYKYLNSSKSEWGICSFITNEHKWIEFGKEDDTSEDSMEVVKRMFKKAIEGTELGEYLDNFDW